MCARLVESFYLGGDGIHFDVGELRGCFLWEGVGSGEGGGLKGGGFAGYNIFIMCTSAPL